MIASDTAQSTSVAKGLAQARSRLSGTRLVQNRGRVTQMIGLVIESQGPMASVGEICRIESQITQQSIEAEVVGFRDRKLLLMPLGDVNGICPGSEVIATGHSLRVPVGDQLLGRVINGLGQPLDEQGELSHRAVSELDLVTPHPLKRARITEPFVTASRRLIRLPLGSRPAHGYFCRERVGNPRSWA